MPSDNRCWGYRLYTSLKFSEMVGLVVWNTLKVKEASIWLVHLWYQWMDSLLLTSYQLCTSFSGRFAKLYFLPLIYPEMWFKPWVSPTSLAAAIPGTKTCTSKICSFTVPWHCLAAETLVFHADTPDIVQYIVQYIFQYTYSDTMPNTAHTAP